MVQGVDESRGGVIPMPLSDTKAVVDEIGKLNRLTDEQLIMLALAELIMANTNIPPGLRIPLHAVLCQRGGRLENVKLL